MFGRIFEIQIVGKMKQYDKYYSFKYTKLF